MFKFNKLPVLKAWFYACRTEKTTTKVDSKIDLR